MAEALAKADCKHEYVFGGLCGACGRDVSKTLSGDMVKVMGWGMTHDGLLVSKEKAVQQAKQVEERLLKAQKLALIVDLDQTLIHTTVDTAVEPWAENGTPDLFRFRLPGNATCYYTKLRPNLRDFLEFINTKYEMHVFTFGTRQYALDILKIIDPTRKYFGNRILTKDESFDPRNKTLNLASLFPGGTHMVAIIDDTQPVWEYTESLVPAVPYIYFKNVEEVNAITHKDVSSEVVQFRRMCDVRLNVASRLVIPPYISSPLADLFSNSVEIYTAVCDAVLAHVQNFCEWQTDTNLNIADNIQRCLDRVGWTEDTTAAQQWAAEIEQMVKDTEAQWDTVHPPVGSERSVQEDLQRAVAYVHTMFSGGTVEFSVADQATLTSNGHDESAAATSGATFSSSTASAAAASGAHKFKQPNRRLVAKTSPQSLRFHFTPTDSSPVATSVRDVLLDAIDCIQLVTYHADGSLSGMVGPCLGVIEARTVTPANNEALARMLKCGKQRAAVLGVRILKHLAPKHFWPVGDDVGILLAITSGMQLFMRCARQRAPPDTDDWLRPMQEILAEVHREFYEASESMSRSVPGILEHISANRQDYIPWCLRGVCILFSGVIPLGTPPHLSPLWQAARSHGARCVTVMDHSVTHIVASGITDKVKRAIRHGSHAVVVKVEWLYECLKAKRRLLEAPYELLAEHERKRLLDEQSEAAEEETLGLPEGRARAAKRKAREDEEEKEQQAREEDDDNFDKVTKATAAATVSRSRKGRAAGGTAAGNGVSGGLSLSAEDFEEIEREMEEAGAEDEEEEQTEMDMEDELEDKEEADDAEPRDDEGDLTDEFHDDPDD